MPKTVEIDKGYNAIMAEARGTKKPHVVVGWLEGGGTSEDGTPIATYMFYNEVGTDTIPARNALGITAETSADKVSNMLQAGLLKIIGGKSSFKKELSKVGIHVKNQTKIMITTIKDPPNAPSTIAAKGSSNPLIDSGTARNAVAFEVRE